LTNIKPRLRFHWFCNGSECRYWVKKVLFEILTEIQALIFPKNGQKPGKV